MRAYYRNKETGEIKDVEQDSAEMFALQEEVSGDGMPKWEQTAFHDVAATKERAKFGELDETDLGKDHQNDLRGTAVALNTEGVAPEANPHLALTPGEIESGLTPAQKQKDLEAMFDGDQLADRQGVFESAADAIADERDERAAEQQARGMRARAGGSDEREGVGVATASDDAPAPSASEPTPPSRPGGGSSPTPPSPPAGS